MQTRTSSRWKMLHESAQKWMSIGVQKPLLLSRFLEENPWVVQWFLNKSENYSMILDFKQKGSTNAIFCDQLMANIAAISGSKTSLPKPAATTNTLLLNRTPIFHLTKTSSTSPLEPIKIYPFLHCCKFSPIPQNQQPFFNKPQNPVFNGSATLLANMDIWSSAQGVYIFVRTNDISVVRCDEHTELPQELVVPKPAVGNCEEVDWAEVSS